jgi:hypothetical protein
MNLPKDYDEVKDEFGDPQEYKGLKIYPILLKDYQHYFSLSLFNWNKNIYGLYYKRMSQLKFLFFESLIAESQNEKSFDLTIKNLLEYVFKKNIIFYFSFDSSSEKILYESKLLVSLLQLSKENFEKIKFWVRIFDEESDTYIPDTNFNIIKDIITYQNCYPYDEIGIEDPKLYETLNEAMRIKNQTGENIDLSKQMVNFAISQKMNFEDLKSLTFYQFMMGVQVLDNIYEFSYLSPLEISGQIKGKGRSQLFPHNWLKNTKRLGRYHNVVVEAKPIINKLKNDLNS